MKIEFNRNEIRDILKDKLVETGLINSECSIDIKVSKTGTIAVEYDVNLNKHLDLKESKEPKIEQEDSEFGSDVE